MMLTRDVLISEDRSLELPDVDDEPIQIFIEFDDDRWFGKAMNFRKTEDGVICDTKIEGREEQGYNRFLDHTAVVPATRDGKIVEMGLTPAPSNRDLTGNTMPPTVIMEEEE